MPAESRHAAVNALDDEDDQLAEDEFQVDCILHERQTPKGVEYLLKWQGYDVAESTWQTADDLTSGGDRILARWEHDKKQINDGFADPFDLEDWERRNFAFHNPGLAIPVFQKQPQAARKSVSQKSVPRKVRHRSRDRIFVSSGEESESSRSDRSGLARQRKKSTTLEKSKSAPAKESAELMNNTKKNELDTVATEPQPLKSYESEVETTIAQNAIQGRHPGSPTNKRKELPTTTDRTTVKRTKSVSNAPKDVPDAARSEPSSMLSTTSVSKESSADPLKQAQKSEAAKAAKQSEPQRTVFVSNEDNLPGRRTRKLQETGRIYAPSHVQNIVKQKQDGAAPDPRNLILQNPSDLAGRPLNYQGRSPDTPSAPIAPPMALSLAMNSDARPSLSAQSTAKPALEAAQSIPLSCNYYASGLICPEDRHRCRFLHEKHDDLPIADIAYHVQARECEHNPEQWPKFNDPVIVCGFECRGQGSCFRKEACAYAHWKPIKGKWLLHDHQITKPKQKTCLYWKRGNCNKSAEECSFAHEMLEETASPAAFATMALTCPFWFDATYSNAPPCRMGVECRFAHEVKPMIAHRPREKTGPQPMDPEILRAATENPLIHNLRPELRETVKTSDPPPLQIDVQPTLHQDTEVTTPTTPFQEISLDSPGTAADAIDDPMEVIMDIEQSVPGDFSMTLDFGFVEILVQFPGLDNELKSSLQFCFGPVISQVHPHQGIWNELQAFILPVYSNKVASGNLVAPGFEIDLAELADCLAQEESALTVQANDMILIMFPSRGDLQVDGPPPESTIGYEIRKAAEPIPPMEDVEAVDDSESWSQWFKITFGMDVEDLFTWPANPPTVKKEVCLFLDNDQEIEIETLSRCFRMLGIPVYTVENSGSWDEFKRRNEGVVILDERFTDYREIPHLSHMLFCRYNFFEFAAYPQTQSLSLKRLFKTGHTLFLTDEVLMEEPDKLLPIVQHVREKNKGKLPGSETRRLFARPKLTDWLYKLAEDRMEDHKAGNVSRASLWDEIRELAPIDSPREVLTLNERVLFEPYWVRSHAENFEVDPTAATEALLEAFDTTFCFYREQSRNWIVLHPGSKEALKKAEEWKQKYRNMRFMTPDNFREKIMARG